MEIILVMTYVSELFRISEQEYFKGAIKLTVLEINALK